MSIAHITRPAGTRLPPVIRSVRLTVLCICSGLLAACAQQSTLYSWDSYQPAVYQYLQGDEDPAADVLAMEKNIETARAHDKALPPGFHAHLGLLYLQQGKGAQAMEQIRSERATFPESAPFMDFLLRQSNGPDKQDATSTTVRTQQVPAAARTVESTKVKQPS